MKSFSILLVCLLLFSACKKHDEIPSTKANFDFLAKDANSNSSLFTYYGNTYYDYQTQIVLLTDAFSSEYGGVFYKFKQDISQGFELEFDFSITKKSGVLDCSNNSGGDGLALVLLAGNTITVAAGGGLGYDGTSNCIAVEIDTWCNNNLNDPNGNHISIHTGYDGENSASEYYSLGLADNLIDMSNGNVHTLGISYRDKTLTVYLDRASILSSKSGAFDISKILKMIDNQVFIGLTSTTGGAYECHNIHRFKLKVL